VGAIVCRSVEPTSVAPAVEAPAVEPTATAGQVKVGPDVAATSPGMADSPPPPPGMAEALNVEAPVTSTAAAKPIAILRIMMLTPFVQSTLAFPNQTEQFPLSCSVRHSRSVSRLRSPSSKDRSRDVGLMITDAGPGKRSKIDRAQTIATSARSPMSGLSAQERADAASVGFLRGVANKPHAAPALIPHSSQKGRGLRCDPGV